MDKIRFLETINSCIQSDPNISSAFKQAYETKTRDLINEEIGERDEAKDKFIYVPDSIDELIDKGGF